MIFYIDKKEMISKFEKDYFGLTEYFTKKEANIYIRSDLPKSVQESVLAHEQHHAKQGKHTGELGAWIAGFKGNWKGFFLGMLLSLRWSRLKMYPELVSAVLAVTIFSLLIYFNN